MTEGSGGGGPDERTDFGWLYGKRPGAQPAEEDARPEATRMLPVQQRPGTAPRGAPAVPPTPPRPVTPPRQAHQAPSPGRGDGRRGGSLGRFWGRYWAKRLPNPFFYVRFVLLLVLLFVIYTLAVPFVTWKNVDKVAWEPGGDRPADQPGTTYLMVGSDSRAGLTKQQRQEFHTGDPQSQLTDTIMLLHTGDGPNLLLSIPRDSDVDSKYASPNGMINGLFAKGGYPLLATYLEDATGIRIDKFVEIGLGGVAGVVDSVGGIRICPERRMDDKDAGLHITKGCQEVDGATALAYSRSRHAQLRGDLDRVRHQREVVAAIGKKVLSPWSVLNPVRWWRLNHSVPGFFAFGEGMSTVDAGRWALAMSKTSGKDGLTCTMPVTDGSAHTWDRDRADPLFQAIIDDHTDKVTDAECTPTGIAGVK